MTQRKLPEYSSFTSDNVSVCAEQQIWLGKGIIGCLQGACSELGFLTILLIGRGLELSTIFADGIPVHALALIRCLPCLWSVDRDIGDFRQFCFPFLTLYNCEEEICVALDVGAEGKD